jgi:hypothetical protein
MISTQAVLIQIGLSLLVAITTVGLTGWLSLRRFYREKWWESKMAAYTNVIQALHHMKRDIEISIAAEVTHRNTDSDYYKEWAAKHRAAWDEIRKQIDIGEFLYSQQSLLILKKLNESTDHNLNLNYFEHLETLEMAVSECLPAIKESA